MQEWQRAGLDVPRMCRSDSMHAGACVTRMFLSGSCEDHGQGSGADAVPDHQILSDEMSDAGSRAATADDQVDTGTMPADCRIFHIFHPPSAICIVESAEFAMCKTPLSMAEFRCVDTITHLLISSRIHVLDKEYGIFFDRWVWFRI